MKSILSRIGYAPLTPLALILSMYALGKWVDRFSLPPDSFASQIHHPAKITVISRFDKPKLDDFMKEIGAVNQDGTFDRNVFSTTYDDTDVMIYFVDGWSDVKSLPGQDALSSIYKRAEEADIDTFYQSIQADMNGRPMLFVFYNLEKLGNKPIKCFAEDLKVKVSDEKPAAGVGLPVCTG